MSEDDPRERELHQALCAAWAKPTPSTRPTDDEARDLLARLDAAAPARDDTTGLRRWLDGEIATGRRDLEEAEQALTADTNATDAADVEWVAARLGALREVRERLGATTEGVRDA